MRRSHLFVLVGLAVVGLAGACDSEPGVALGEGPFGSPDDFDRTGCEDARPMTSVELSGIWHLDLDFGPAGKSVQPVRIDGDGDRYDALVFGAPAAVVSVTDSDVYMRVAWIEDAALRTRSLDWCRVDGDGTVFGKYASCRDDECSLATFTAYPVRPLDEPASSGMTLVGAYDWGADVTSANVRVHDGVAYVVNFEDGLRVLDVSDPSQPVEVGHLPVADPNTEIFNDVKVVPTDNATYVIVASNRRGAITVDVTQPSAPREVISYPVPDAGSDRVNVHTVFVEGDRAYLANTSVAGLDIFDISNPEVPIPLGRYINPAALSGGYLHDMYVSGGRVYLNYWNLGMVVIDTLENPANPTFVGGFESYQRRKSHSVWVTNVAGRNVAVHGDEDLDAHVRIVDVDAQSGEFMTQIGAYQTRRQVSVHNIMAVGELAFVTYYQDGVRILDISDPTSPTEIAHYHTWPGAEPGYGRSFYEGAIGVDYDAINDLIYIVDTHRHLLILSLDP